MYQGAFGQKLVHHIQVPGASRAVAGDEKGKVSQGLGIKALSARASLVFALQPEGIVLGFSAEA